MPARSELLAAAALRVVASPPSWVRSLEGTIFLHCLATGRSSLRNSWERAASGREEYTEGYSAEASTASEEDGTMAHTITLTDEQFARLQAAAQHFHRPPEQVLADLLNWLPEPRQLGMSAAADAQRWADFWSLVGSIRHGQPFISEEIDELIGEEAADPHADASA